VHALLDEASKLAAEDLQTREDLAASGAKAGTFTVRPGTVFSRLIFFTDFSSLFFLVSALTSFRRSVFCDKRKATHARQGGQRRSLRWGF
jgi:hypothetical protein